MERDQHSSAGHGAGDRTRIRADGLSPERERPPDAPAGDGQDAAAKPAEPALRPEPHPGERPDVIMSKLPRTRPQRATGRRRRESGTPSTPEATATPQKRAATAASRKRAAAQRTTAAKRSPAQTGPASQRSGPRRPKTRAGTARAATQGTAARAAQAEATARSRAARRAPAPRTASSAPPPRSGNGSPPGLPRLAIDGAVEAAKLPLKVGGRLTLRALDAVARGLRGG